MPETDNKQLRDVVSEAWKQGFTIMSDYARRNAAYVAMAASQSLITTQVEQAEYGRTWRVTNKGLRWLNESKA